MALRSYMYAKHLSATQVALINKQPDPVASDTASCPPERALVLEDGTKVCADCADCPKKAKADDGSPRIKVQVESEVDYTTQPVDAASQ